MIAILLALGAALLFAAGSALQQRGLERRRLWFAGTAADGLGFLCQASALALGRLAVVQPVMASSLVFALFFGGRRPTPRELCAGVAVAGGLGAFLVSADPVGGRADAALSTWMPVFSVCAALSLLAWRGGPVRLGCATGVLFGLSAALTKTVVDGAWLSWPAGALLVVGGASMVLAQLSLNAGALGPAVAAQMTLDAVTSVAIGVLAFGERLHTSAVGLALALSSLAVMACGLSLLATAPADRSVAP